MTQENIQSVITEIETIKEHATDEEKARLNWGTFDPSDSTLCIYGQMTGDCCSTRSFEFLKLSGDDDCRCYLEAYIMDYPKHNQQILQYLKGEITELPDLSVVANVEA